MSEIANLLRLPINQLGQLLMIEGPKLGLHIAAESKDTALQRHGQTMVLPAGNLTHSVVVHRVGSAAYVVPRQETSVLFHFAVLLAATLGPDVLLGFWIQDHTSRASQRRSHLLIQDFNEFNKAAIFEFEIVIVDSLEI